MTKSEALEIAATAPTPTHELLAELIERTFKAEKPRKARKAKAAKKAANSPEK